MAASEDGRYEAGMGIDARRRWRRGRTCNHTSRFRIESLYHNNHDGTFNDAYLSLRLGNKAFASGVSMSFLDSRHDGWPDILQLNGAMLDNVHLYHGEVSYKEPC